MNPFSGSQATVLNQGRSSSASKSMERRGEAIAKLSLGSAIPGLIPQSALPVSLPGEVPQRSPASIGSIHDPS